MKTKIILFLMLTCGYMATSQVRPGFWWQCQKGDMLVNHHPSKQIQKGGLFLGAISPSYSYTILTVYRQKENGEESGIWYLKMGDSNYRAQTTDQILSPSSTIHYENSVVGVPTIITLEQSVSKDDTLPKSYELFLGSIDGKSSESEISEVLYFPTELGISQLRKVQSYLAVKYGITLGPVNYVKGDGSTIWNYTENKDYHHRITGIGIDSTYSLNQPASKSENEGSNISIACKNLEEGDYILLGDNDCKNTFQKVGDVESLERNWKVVVTTSKSSVPVCITLDRRSISGNNLSLSLVTEAGIYQPTTITDNAIVFDSVLLGKGTSHISFERKFSEDGSNGNEYCGNASIDVYPNPTTGHYSIRVQGSKNVTINIYSLSGQKIKTYRGTDQNQYLYEGTLPSGSSYYVTVITDDGEQTTKLIVK